MAGAGPGAGGGQHGSLRASLQDVGSTRPREANTRGAEWAPALGWHWPPPCDSCTLCHRLSPPLAGRASRGRHPRTRRVPPPSGVVGGPAVQGRSTQSHATAKATATHGSRATPPEGHRGHCWSQGSRWEDRVAGALPPQVLVQDGPPATLWAPGAGTEQDRSPIGQWGPNPEPAVSVPPAPSLLPGSPPPASQL